MKEEFQRNGMVELYFNNHQDGGIDMFNPLEGNPPAGLNWYRVGSYEYKVALDLAHLYLQIPFMVRKTLGEIEIGEKHWGARK